MANSFEDAKLVLGLGAPRTGTKWMSNYFTSHPEILMSPIRVLHYFDARHNPKSAEQYNTQFQERFAKAAANAGPKRAQHVDQLRDRVAMITDEGAYLDFFRKRWTGEKAFADITPAYWLLGPDAYKDMLKTHPNVKFLFVMRNPIDRYWSGLRLKQMRDPTVDAMEKFDRRALSGPREPRENDERQDYRATITNLESAVPAGAIKYFFFERLFNMQAIEELCDFLGVKVHPAPVETAVNQSDPMPLDAGRRRGGFKAFESDYRFISEKFNGDLPESWLDDISRFSGT